MSTTSIRLRQPGRGRWERWLIGLALLAIVAWGWIGVDTSILDELSSTVSQRERRAWAEGAVNFAPGPSTSAAAGPFDDGSGTPAELVAAGQAVFEAMGCNACHSIDGSPRIGPSLAGLWGTEQVMDDGSIALMESDYFRESVLQPQVRIVAGYLDAAMPSYEGLVSDEDLEALAAYVESLQ